MGIQVACRDDGHSAGFRPSRFYTTVTPVERLLTRAIKMLEVTSLARLPNGSQKARAVTSMPPRANPVPPFLVG